MTEQNLDTVVETTEPVAEKPQKDRHCSRGSLFLALLALIIAGGVAVWVYLDHKQQQKNQEIFRDIANTVDSTRAAQQQNTSALKEQAEKLHGLNESVEQLQTVVHQNEQSWVLTEIDYLVRLANYNLQYVGDVMVAKKLLELADQRLQAMNNPKLSTLRAMISNNVLQMGGDNAVDVEKILERLNQLSANIPELHILSQVTTAAAPVATPANSEENWQEKLKSSLSTLQSVVTVRKLTEAPKPLMTPDQHANLVENIQLKLAVAQWAVLHRKQELYASSLAAAKNWLTTYFRKDDMNLAVINGISELEQAKIMANLPDLKATVIAVHEAIQSLSQQLPAPAASAPASPTPAAKPKTEPPAKEESPNQPQVLSS